MAIIFLGYRKKNPFVLHYREPWSGRKRQKSFPTNDEAKAFEAIMQEQFEHEKALLRQQKRRESKRYSIRIDDLMQRYLSTLSNISTQQSSRYHAQSFLDIFGKRQAQRLQVGDILSFMAIARERGVSESTINRRIGIIRAGVNWGVRNGFLLYNPLSQLRLKKAKSQRNDPPTPLEAELLIHKASPHVARVVLLGYATGARIGPSELFRLRWSNVDIERRSIRMPTAGKGSAQAYRGIPLKEELVPLMLQWKNVDEKIGAEFVIHYRGRPVRRISKAWRNALRRAGITRYIRPYDLRHAFATYALEAQADIGTVAEIMSHRDKSMILTVYQHISYEQKLRVIEKLPSLIKTMA